MPAWCQAPGAMLGAQGKCDPCSSSYWRPFPLPQPPPIKKGLTTRGWHRPQTGYWQDGHVRPTSHTRAAVPSTRPSGVGLRSEVRTLLRLRGGQACTREVHGCVGGGLEAPRGATGMGDYGVPRGDPKWPGWEGGEMSAQASGEEDGLTEGGFGSPQDRPAGPAQVWGEVPWLEGGCSHGNRCSPSVASDNLLCASGSMTPPLRCQAVLAERVLIPAWSAADPWRACPWGAGRREARLLARAPLNLPAQPLLPGG